MRTILATLLAALAVNAHADTIPAECEKALQGTFERDKRIGGSFADELTREFKLPMKVQKLHPMLAYALLQDEKTDPGIVAKVRYVYGLPFRLVGVTGGWLGIAVKKTR